SSRSARATRDRGSRLAPSSAARTSITQARRKEDTMSLRFTASALASVLCLTFGNASTAHAQLLGGSRPLAVPVTGSVSGGGTFIGSLSIQRFAVQGSATVAVATIAG